MPEGLAKHGFQAHEWHLLTDDAGVPVGRYKTPIQPCLEEVKIIRAFLCRIKVEQRTEGVKEMSNGSEQTNMVFLAGTLKLPPKVDDKVVKCLIDVGMKNAIPCGCYKDNKDGIADKLARYDQGDFIRVVAMLDPYGVKQADGSWRNGMSIKITQIKNDPPRRAQQKAQQQELTDDDIPF